MPLNSERDHSFGTSFFLCVFFGVAISCLFTQVAMLWCLLSCVHVPGCALAHELLAPTTKTHGGDGWCTGNQRQVRHMLQSINYYLLGLCNSLVIKWEGIWKPYHGFFGMVWFQNAHIYIYIYIYRWWRWVRAKLQQFSVCATFPKNQKIFSSRNRPGCLEGMVQSYTPDVGLVLTMIVQVNVNVFFWRDFIGGRGFKKCGTMFSWRCFKIFQDVSNRKKVAYFLGRHSVCHGIEALSWEALAVNITILDVHGLPCFGTGMCGPTITSW